MNQHRAVIAAGAAFFAAASVLVIWLRSSYEPSTTQSTEARLWQPSEAFNDARRAHAAAASERFIYVLGGVDDQGKYVPSVEYSSVGDQHTLIPWQYTRPLPEGRFYLGAAIVNERLYAVGGATGELGDDNVPSASVHSAQIGDDGRLGPWRREAYLSTPRRGLQVVVFDQRIYAVGGYNGSFLRSVEVAEPDESGRIGEWIVAQEEATQERYMHAATAASGRLYVLTGHIEGRPGMGFATVESAPIESAGLLGPWRREDTQVTQARFLAAAISLNNAVYLLGGHDGTQRLASVEATALGHDGRPGPWRSLGPMTTARSAAAAVVFGGGLYAVGGSGADGALNTVEFMPIN